MVSIGSNQFEKRKARVTLILLVILGRQISFLNAQLAFIQPAPSVHILNFVLIRIFIYILSTGCLNVSVYSIFTYQIRNENYKLTFGEHNLLIKHQFFFERQTQTSCLRDYIRTESLPGWVVCLRLTVFGVSVASLLCHRLINAKD